MSIQEEDQDEESNTNIDFTKTYTSSRDDDLLAAKSPVILRAVEHNLNLNRL